jgi:hypothetical protein
MSRIFCYVAMLVAIFTLPALGQNQNRFPNFPSDMSSANDPMVSNNSAMNSPQPMDPARAQWEKLQVKHENQERQVALKRDTDKLLELATELKQNVDRTGPNILSIDVVKRAQEIEKLAKSVKEKMKGD